MLNFWRSLPRAVRTLIIVGVVLLARWYFDRPYASGRARPTDAPVVVRDQEDPIATAFHNRDRDVPVLFWGIVTRILPDDRDGSRHQRFLLRTPGGSSVLVAHNIDLAPRLAPIAVGDTVQFEGEYVWNEQGGVVHWTHHDPDHRHRDGFLAIGADTVR